MAVAAGCKKPAGGRGHVEKHVETPRGERTRDTSGRATERGRGHVRKHLGEKGREEREHEFLGDESLKKGERTKGTTELGADEGGKRRVVSKKLLSNSHPASQKG